MDIKETTSLLGALAQETRLSLFRLLIKQGEKGLCAGDIAKHLSVPPSTLSYHLNELEQADLIRSHKIQRRIFYRANFHKLEEFLAFLVEDCCQATGDICLTLQNNSEPINMEYSS